MERAQNVVAARYQLVRKLGQGGMGTVWLAHDLALDARCALKLIDHERRTDPEARLRFAREARVAAQIRGPHVVDVFDHGEWEDVPYIAMEYLQGEDLGARLERCGRLDPEATHRIVAQVARALTRAHAAGIVHRDLKPENVFLARTEEGEVAKVLDFGIAQHHAYSLQNRATLPGSFVGTPYYASPEQARGLPVDHRADLWSLAVIAFYCLTGKPPFEGEAIDALMTQLLYARLPLPSEREPSLPAPLDAWWLRAANREPGERFQSAAELAEALAAALGVGEPSWQTSSAPLSTAPVAHSRPPAPPPRRRRSLVFGLSGLLLGAGLTLALSALPRWLRPVTVPLSTPVSGALPLPPASSARPPVATATATPPRPSASAAPRNKKRAPARAKPQKPVRRPPRRDAPDYGI